MIIRLTPANLPFLPISVGLFDGEERSRFADCANRVAVSIVQAQLADGLRVPNSVRQDVGRGRKHRYVVRDRLRWTEHVQLHGIEQLRRKCALSSEDDIAAPIVERNEGDLRAAYQPSRRAGTDTKVKSLRWPWHHGHLRTSSW